MKPLLLPLLLLLWAPTAPAANRSPRHRAGPDGTPGDVASSEAALSGDGRTVAFSSATTNLAAGGGRGRGTLAQAGSTAQVFTRDLEVVAGAVTQLLSQAGGSPGDAPSGRPALSFDATTVAFQSQALNLRPGATGPQADILVVARPAGAPPPDRPVITAPADGSSFPLPEPTPVTFAWTRVGREARYGVEFTGPDLRFTNPNDTVPDGVNGFGGRGGGALFEAPGFTVTLDPAFPRGSYQVRVIGLDADNRPVGRFSDAITLFLGRVEGQPAFTAPAPGSVLRRGTRVAFAWTPLAPGVPQYLFEFTPPGRQFTNPNAAGPDPVNGFGGEGGGFLVPGTGFEVELPADVARGTYQVRVLGVSATLQPLGRSSDALTVVVE